MAHSIVDWWNVAGVDGVYADDPTNWLETVDLDTKMPSVREAAATTESASVASPAGEPHSRAPDAPPAPRPAAPPSSPDWSVPQGELPDSLDAFQTWWTNEPALDLPGRQGPRIAPHGASQADAMILADMPDADDAEQLFTGSSGRLLDNILRAAGFDRERCYLAALLPQRVLDRRLPQDQIAYFTRAMQHQIGLVAPKNLVLLGAMTNLALTGNDLAQNQRQLRFVNHLSGNIAATASFHPRTLLAQTGLKPQAWKDWQKIMGVKA